jgi:hypothetical protein
MRTWHAQLFSLRLRRMVIKPLDFITCNTIYVFDNATHSQARRENQMEPLEPPLDVKLKKDEVCVVLLVCYYNVCLCVTTCDSYRKTFHLPPTNSGLDAASGLYRGDAGTGERRGRQPRNARKGQGTFPATHTPNRPGLLCLNSAECCPDAESFHTLLHMLARCQTLSRPSGCRSWPSSAV